MKKKIASALLLCIFTGMLFAFPANASDDYIWPDDTNEIIEIDGFTTKDGYIYTSFDGNTIIEMPSNPHILGHVGQVSKWAEVQIKKPKANGTPFDNWYYLRQQYGWNSDGTACYVQGSLALDGIIKNFPDNNHDTGLYRGWLIGYQY